MTLATRCPACGTAFRIAPDQFAAADGWVRCGRCGEVFDATPALFDAESRRPAAPPDDLPGMLDAAPLPGRPESGADEPAEMPPAPAEADDVPSFARPSAAEARPAVQRALAVAAVLLAVALPLQAALHWRDLIAAAWPDARPMLDALCRAAGCRVEPLRRLDSLAIDGSALAHAPSGRAMKLAVTLRNRGGLPVALPWVDLTLTEVNGAPLARKMLSPADLGATSTTIAPGAEAALQATLALDGRPPSGYTVELFYP